MARMGGKNSHSRGLRGNVSVLELDVVADASGGLTFNTGFDAPRTVVDVLVIPTAAAAASTIQLGDGTNAISDAIACAVLDTLGRASTIDLTYAKVGKTVELTGAGTNATDVRAKVLVYHIEG